MNIIVSLTIPAKNCDHVVNDILVMLYSYSIVTIN